MRVVNTIQIGDVCHAGTACRHFVMYINVREQKCWISSCYCERANKAPTNSLAQPYYFTNNSQLDTRHQCSTIQSQSFLLCTKFSDQHYCLNGLRNWYKLIKKLIAFSDYCHAMTMSNTCRRACLPLPCVIS